MVRLDNHLGKISVSNAYFANLIGQVASECFGVSGLVNSTPSQGLRRAILRREIPDRGVRIRSSGGNLIIDLHISVTYGVNIAEIVKSIAHKVTYTVEAASGLIVTKVNVYIADMQS